MRTTKFVAVAAAVAAFGMASVAEAAAQACIGAPTISGQRALTGGLGFPEGATNYHARLDVNRGGPFAYNVNYSHTTTDGAGVSMNAIGAGLAYELPTPVIPGAIAVSGCPVVGASYAFSSGGEPDQHRLDVPLGFGLGTRIYLGAGTSLVPYVTPQFVFSRTSTTVDGSTVRATDHGLGATLGTAFDFGPFFAGVDYSTTRWNDVPATDSNFGVRLGVKF